MLTTSLIRRARYFLSYFTAVKMQKCSCEELQCIGMLFTTVTTPHICLKIQQKCEKREKKIRDLLSDKVQICTDLQH